MKKFKLWSLTMLAVLALPLMVACGDDDDNNGSSYTSEEIVELLTGKWEIDGEFRINDAENKQQISGNYTGTIEFKDNQKFSSSIKVTVDRNDTEATESDVQQAVSGFLDNYNGYQILKKDGKNYICIRKKYNFEILSLNKTTFSFVMNQDLTGYNSSSEEVVLGHVYMTMVSD